MQHFGFVKVGAGVPNVFLANPVQNAAEIFKLVKQAHAKGVRTLVLPELCLTGYSCGDLFLHPQLVQSAEICLQKLLAQTALLDIIFIVGLPVKDGAVLLNAAVVCYKGKILGVVPKTYLPNGNEFYETRWFVPSLAWNKGVLTLCGQTVPAGTDLLFHAGGFTFGVEICEDVWAVVPPSSRAALQGAEVIFNLSASNTLVGKRTYVENLLAQQSARAICGYVYTSCGAGESTTDVVFSGNTWIYENGQCLAKANRFEDTDTQLLVSEIDIEYLQNERIRNSSFRTDTALETQEPYELLESCQPLVPLSKLTRTIRTNPFIAADENFEKQGFEIFEIQTSGLMRRLQAARAKTAVVGISGGLDSTLALLVAVHAADKLGWPRKNIVGITMPCFGTTDRTYQNALLLMKKLKISMREISIKEACLQHFKDIAHNPKIQDTTFENAQARERTQVLMDVANQTGGIVVGTGDLSELALGWATYNGDHMSMYGVNAGVPKTVVRELVAWAANRESFKNLQPVLADILHTPVSPELLPAKNGKIAQKTEDLVGPYELHDFFLFHFVRRGFNKSKILFLAEQAFQKKFPKTVIEKWLHTFIRRFFAQQFKRSCMPDGPKVGSVGLSPRGDFKMPSDADPSTFLL